MDSYVGYCKIDGYLEITMKDKVYHCLYGGGNTSINIETPVNTIYDDLGNPHYFYSGYRETNIVLPALFCGENIPLGDLFLLEMYRMQDGKKENKIIELHKCIIIETSCFDQGGIHRYENMKIRSNDNYKLFN
jgi:hypothetical protein